MLLAWALWAPGAVLAQPVDAPGPASNAVLQGPVDEPPILVLRAQRQGLQAWPALRTMPEPPGSVLQAQTVLAQRHLFVKPDTPYGNLGMQPGAVWLRLIVRVPEGASANWVFDVDSPTMDEVDVHLVQAGHIVQSLHSGDTVPSAQRPLKARSMAIPLHLRAGEDHELLVRVKNNGVLRLPVKFLLPGDFHFNESRFQLLQGLLAGMGLCLLAYSALQWAGARDAMFVYYALTLTGTTLFLLSFHGLGTQHLWPDDHWLVNNAPLVFALVGLSASFLFADRALGMSAVWPRWSALTRGLAVACAVVMAGFVAGTFSYRFTHGFATFAGVLPFVMTVPLALHKARGGDAAARYLLMGLVAYAVGVLVMSQLMRGNLPMTPLTLHLFQVSSAVEMVMWMAVLSAHTDRMRRAGRVAEQERAEMATLALVDPLTGLANRRGLRKLGLPIVQQAGPDNAVVVFMLDLDNFKPVNDAHGHDVGDKLLVGVAGRLRGVLGPRAGAAVHAAQGPSHCVARLGGDEFVVVVGGLGHADEAQALALRFQQAVLQPFYLGGLTCQVGATVGYALAREPSQDLTALLQQADGALYAGKRHGRGQVRSAGPGDWWAAEAPPAAAVAAPGGGGDARSRAAPAAQ